MLAEFLHSVIFNGNAVFTYNQGNLYKAAGTDTTIYTYGSDRDKFGGRFDAGKGPFNRYGTANTNLPLTKTQGGVKTSYTYLKNASGYVSKVSGLLTTGKLSNSYPACSCK